MNRFFGIDSSVVTMLILWFEGSYTGFVRVSYYWDIDTLVLKSDGTCLQRAPKGSEKN